MKKLILSIFILLNVTSSFAAGLLIISDIDDTLKPANIKKPADAIRRISVLNSTFAAMPRLYDELNKIPQSRIVYLSNAPKELMGLLHPKFLKKWGYPKGELFFRPLSGKNHDNFKFNKASEIIEQMNPDFILLIGDNGEQDPVVYDRLAQKFNQIPSLSMIRATYGKNNSTALKEGQVPFVSTLEILSRLQNNNTQFPWQMSDTLVDEFASKFTSTLYNVRGEVQFAPLQSCEGFNLSLGDLESRFSKIQEVLDTICK